METKKYLDLIQEELNKMPDFVKEYNFGTSHSLATSYQYLTEIRR
ncbi:MAG: tyrosine recombinase XerS, partial [Lactobacillaceae bacterium]